MPKKVRKDKFAPKVEIALKSATVEVGVRCDPIAIAETRIAREIAYAKSFGRTHDSSSCNLLCHCRCRSVARLPGRRRNRCAAAILVIVGCHLSNVAWSLPTSATLEMLLHYHCDAAPSAVAILNAVEIPTTNFLRFFPKV